MVRHGRLKSFYESEIGIKYFTSGVIRDVSMGDFGGFYPQTDRELYLYLSRKFPQGINNLQISFQDLQRAEG